MHLIGLKTITKNGLVEHGLISIIPLIKRRPYRLIISLWLKAKPMSSALARLQST